MNYLCIALYNLIIMNKESLKKKMDSWQRLYDAFYEQPFDILKEEVQRTDLVKDFINVANSWYL